MTPQSNSIEAAQIEIERLTNPHLGIGFNYVMTHADLARIGIVPA